MAQMVCPKGTAVINLEREYEQIKQTAEMYQRAGLGFEYNAEREKLQTLINKLPKIYLDQEIASFPLTRNPSCLAVVYSQFVGQQVQFQPRSDNKWNVFVSGVKKLEAITDEELISLIKKVK